MEFMRVKYYFFIYTINDPFVRLIAHYKNTSYYIHLVYYLFVYLHI